MSRHEGIAALVAGLLTEETTVAIGHLLLVTTDDSQPSPPPCPAPADTDEDEVDA
jgi:hypothetical protein